MEASLDTNVIIHLYGAGLQEILFRRLMNIDSKLKGFIRRFWYKPFSASEKEWMLGFCLERGINARMRMGTLISFIESSHPHL